MVLLKSGASLHLEGPGQGMGGEGISPRSELLPLWLLPIYHHMVYPLPQSSVPLEHLHFFLHLLLLTLVRWLRR